MDGCGVSLRLPAQASKEAGHRGRWRKSRGHREGAGADQGYSVLVSVTPGHLRRLASPGVPTPASCPPSPRQAQGTEGIWAMP